MKLIVGYVHRIGPAMLAAGGLMWLVATGVFDDVAPEVNLPLLGESDVGMLLILVGGLLITVGAPGAAAALASGSRAATWVGVAAGLLLACASATVPWYFVGWLMAWGLPEPTALMRFMAALFSLGLLLQAWSLGRARRLSQLVLLVAAAAGIGVAIPERPDLQVWTTWLLGLSVVLVWLGASAWSQGPSRAVPDESVDGAQSLR
jgi:hypothetical protein